MTGRLLRGVLLWILPAWLLWAALTPFYNRFLLTAAENLLHLVEVPDVTDLIHQGRHDAWVLRRDFPPVKSRVHGFRVTDVHFHLVLLGGLFLGVPGIPWRRRLEALGWAVLVTVFFDLFLCFVRVKAVYATGLGAWSLAHYGPFARNAWGLARHLLDLPFKLALPLLLWAAFYLDLLLAPARKTSPD